MHISSCSLLCEAKNVWLLAFDVQRTHRYVELLSSASHLRAGLLLCKIHPYIAMLYSTILCPVMGVTIDQTYLYQVSELVLTNTKVTCQAMSVLHLMASHVTISQYMGVAMILRTLLKSYDSIFKATPLVRCNTCFVMYTVSHAGPCNN